MKKLLVGLVLVLGFNASAHDVNVHGYVRRDGHYVMPYVRTSPDHTTINNYSGGYVPNPYHQTNEIKLPSVEINPYEIKPINPYLENEQ